MKLLGIISLGSDVTDQLLIRFLAFVTYRRKMGVQLGTTADIRRIQESL
jgi:hypothetical protein